jgi:hypothetical protein
MIAISRTVRPYRAQRSDRELPLATLTIKDYAETRDRTRPLRVTASQIPGPTQIGDDQAISPSTWKTRA